jgi:hypothetical protein
MSAVCQRSISPLMGGAALFCALRRVIATVDYNGHWRSIPEYEHFLQDNERKIIPYPSTE